MGGAYSSLFAGVFSATSAVFPSIVSSILGEPEPNRALRGLAVGLFLLVDLPRDARAVHPAGRANRTTNALEQIGSAIIDTAASGSSSCLVVRYIVGGNPQVYRTLSAFCSPVVPAACCLLRRTGAPERYTQVQNATSNVVNPQYFKFQPISGLFRVYIAPRVWLWPGGLALALERCVWHSHGSTPTVACRRVLPTQNRENVIEIIIDSCHRCRLARGCNRACPPQPTSPLQPPDEGRETGMLLVESTAVVRI